MTETASTARIRRWVLDSSHQRKLAFLLAALSAGAGIATVALMTDTAAIREKADLLKWLLILDGILLVLLTIVVARRVINLWRARQTGAAGAGLQGRLVMLFAMIAVTPAVLIAIFSYSFLNFGLEAWFNERVSKALRDSVGVTQAYLKEHRESIASQAYSLAAVLDQNAPTLIQRPWEFSSVLTGEASRRALPEAMVIDRVGNIVARSDFAISTVVEDIPAEAYESADKGEVALLASGRDDKVRALVRLNRFVGTYLLIEKFVDPRVLQHISGIQQSVDEYNQLEETRSGVQFSFVLIYMIAVLILLLAATWIGMTFSAQLAEPVIKLIGAADKVSKGDLTTRVDDISRGDEIGVLSKAFNNMTARIASQQDGLIAANTELDERRRFTEAVLAGVSAGVIGLDGEQRINLPNKSAFELLNVDFDQHINERLGDVIPELAESLNASAERPDRLQQSEVSITRDNTHKTFLVRVAAERIDGRIIGYVVTFDDVTDLLSAQRKAAWADVARRIAHEIKNPLTPIQLSAERLNRKYLKEIQSDPETFKKCTDTIVRQVGDIGRMVDEFSSFARMPQPEIHPENFSELCRQAVFLEQNRGDDINYEMNIPDDDVTLNCDSRQISRVLTNLMKNAAESIEGARQDNQDDVVGIVRLNLTVTEDQQHVRIVIEDDGRGLPSEDRSRLTEPYVTTRAKGTGLGLAIVKKIVEEHSGTLELRDRQPRGAEITIMLPMVDSDANARENRDGSDAPAVASSS
jgi:two-component system nitrogen regulation sensor histidine kinase NtrY